MLFLLNLSYYQLNLIIFLGNFFFISYFKKEILERNNLDPIVQKKNNIPYLVDQHLLDKKNA